MTHSRVLTSTPVLVVSDLQRAVEFYCSRLGFIDPNVWGEPPCFAMMHRDGFDLMLSLAEDPAHVRPNGPNGIWDMYLRVADLAEEHAALTEADVVIARPPSPTEYEMIEMEVLDPDGYRICFGQNGV